MVNVAIQQSSAPAVLDDPKLQAFFTRLLMHDPKDIPTWKEKQKVIAMLEKDGRLHDLPIEAFLRLLQGSLPDRSRPTQEERARHAKEFLREKGIDIDDL